MHVFHIDSIITQLDQTKMYVISTVRQVSSGQEIGKVLHPGWCSDGHIHLSMRKISSPAEFIDPSKYTEKRPWKSPGWEQPCDHYFAIFMVTTLKTVTIC